MPTPIESMRIVANKLAPLEVPFVFVGGAVIPLLVDDPQLTEFRPTKDVDVVVEVVTYQQFSKLEERLRLAGFQNDMSEGAPICRFTIEGCIVDVMPMDYEVLKMKSKWFPEALGQAEFANLGENCSAKVISPLLFLATKLEAFNDRGKGDYYGSHDLEDIVTLVDGRAKIVEDVSSGPNPIRKFIRESFRTLLGNPDFNDALVGHLSGPGRKRAPLVKQRFEAIARQE